MKKMERMKGQLVLNNEKFETVYKNVEIEEIVEEIKNDILPLNYRYLYVVDDKGNVRFFDYFSEIKEEYKDLVGVGNQGIRYLELEKDIVYKKCYYLVIGYTGIIGVIFGIEDKVYLVRKNPLHPINESYLLKVKERFGVTDEFVVEEEDPTRLDFGKEF